MNTWQPIETAPKDTLVLITGPGFGIDYPRFCSGILEFNVGTEKYEWFLDGWEFREPVKPTLWASVPEGLL